MQNAVRSIIVVLATLATLAACRSVPSAVQRELAKTPRGQTVVVLFTDFQCPFCRRTHAALEPVVRDREGRVRVVLRHVPLPRHPDADGAARAAICAERLGTPAAAEAVARALFTSPDLGEAACEAIAAGVGLDVAQLRACVASPETAQRLTDDLAAFEEAGGDGVPLVFVGDTRLDGSQDRATLERAVDASLASR